MIVLAGASVLYNTSDMYHYRVESTRRGKRCLFASVACGSLCAPGLSCSAILRNWDPRGSEYSRCASINQRSPPPQKPGDVFLSNDASSNLISMPTLCPGPRIGADSGKCRHGADVGASPRSWAGRAWLQVKRAVRLTASHADAGPVGWPCKPARLEYRSQSCSPPESQLGRPRSRCAKRRPIFAFCEGTARARSWSFLDRISVGAAIG